MRRLFERFQNEIVRFIQQRDDLLLNLRVADNDAAVTLKLLRDIEQAQDTDLFILVGHDFMDASGFITAIVDQLREQRDLASRALEEAGKAELPPIPPALDDGRIPEAERLHGCIRYTRSLVPRTGGNNVIWALMPGQVHNRGSWRNLLDTLVPRRGIAAWMHGVRIILRDPGPVDDLLLDLSRSPRTRFAVVDFGSTAIERAVREETGDPSLPLESRMQALCVEASLDHAHGREKDAIAKYHHALGFFQSRANPTMQAMVMHGIGDVHRRGGRAHEARQWYECATEPATACEVPVVLAIVVRSLGQVEYECQRFAEAEQYFAGLDALASRLLDPETKAYALEWKGASQRALGREQEAIGTWEAAATLSRNIGLHVQLRRLLGLLESAYHHAGMVLRARDVSRESASLSSEESPHG